MPWGNDIVTGNLSLCSFKMIHALIEFPSALKVRRPGKKYMGRDQKTGSPDKNLETNAHRKKNAARC